jgi:lipopolysaccharide export system protein LptA
MRGAEVALRADQIDYGETKATVHLSGSVTIETGTVTIFAEDVDYDVNSGEMQVRRGEVKVKLKQPVPPR